MYVRSMVTPSPGTMIVVFVHWRICLLDICTCCHTAIEAADQTCNLTQWQHADTGLTSHSTDPVTPSASQGSPIEYQWYGPPPPPPPFPPSGRLTTRRVQRSSMHIAPDCQRSWRVMTDSTGVREFESKCSLSGRRERFSSLAHKGTWTSGRAAIGLW